MLQRMHQRQHALKIEDRVVRGRRDRAAPLAPSPWQDRSPVSPRSTAPRPATSIASPPDPVAPPATRKSGRRRAPARRCRRALRAQWPHPAAPRHRSAWSLARRCGDPQPSRRRCCQDPPPSECRSSRRPRPTAHGHPSDGRSRRRRVQPRSVPAPGECCEVTVSRARAVIANVHDPRTQIQLNGDAERVEAATEVGDRARHHHLVPHCRGRTRGLK